MIKNISILLTVFVLFVNFSAKAEIIQEILINGNERIPDETILMFSNVNINDSINDKKVDNIIKDLYETNFFEEISVSFKDKSLLIIVKEQPIIDSISFIGIEAKKYKEAIRSNSKLKVRSSYNEFLLFEETQAIKLILKDFGFYFAEVEPYVEKLPNNLVKINYQITLGEKGKIKKITFIGDKIFKDRKLKNIIVSEEYKFWKFLSNRKFLNEEIINLDKRLLQKFYLNKGYYNVEINSSFASRCRLKFIRNL